jgi:hypothetical protein
MLGRSDLRKAQLFVVDTVKRCFSKLKDYIPGVIFAFDMGSGKTIAVLTALVDLFSENRIKKVLVVAPLEVARVTWPDEIEAWEHTRHLRFTVLREEDYTTEATGRINCYHLICLNRGMSAKDAAAEAQKMFVDWKYMRVRQKANDDAQIHIINREGLPWLWEHFRNGKKWPYDVMVIDEASMLKNAQQRVKREKTEEDRKVPKHKRKPAPLSQFGVVAKAAPLCEAVIEMTGTPDPNGLHNLWGLLFPIDLGERLGRNITAFRNRWFNFKPYTHKYEPLPHAEKEIHDKIKDVMFSLDPADYPDTPGSTMIEVKVRLSDEVLRRYRKFENTMVSVEYDVEAVNGGAHFQKLLQFANGFMYDEDGNAIWVHDEKLKALKELYERLDGQPLLVAYPFEEDKERLRKAFPKATFWGDGDPRETKRLWNEGKLKMLVAHPSAIGHGQNIQHGGRYLFWYGLTPDLELWLQFNKRLDRPGQRSLVYIYVCVAEGTRDMQHYETYLEPKYLQMQRTMKATRVDRKHTRD